VFYIASLINRLRYALCFSLSPSLLNLQKAISINNLPHVRPGPNNYFRTSVRRSTALKLAKDRNRVQQRTHCNVQKQIEQSTEKVLRASNSRCNIGM